MQARINGIGMTYRVEGPDEAPPVVLHHPLATNLTIWNELTEALLPAYRVVRLDARGHGGTDAPGGAYTFETLAADVIGLMDHLGIAKTRFFGLSMGGMVGQYLGVLHPDRFHSLCLVSTSSQVPAEARPLWDERIKIVSGPQGMNGVIDGAMARWVAPDALANNKPLVARLRAMILATPTAGYAGWCHAIAGLNVTDRISAITLPAQVVVGALDPATPPAAAQLIHRQIAGSSYVEVPGVSHMLHVEDPASFHAVVLPFLAKHGPKPAGG
jgi:3-oxoadipate enol-lactonase